MLLAPHSVVRSKFLKRHEIVSRHALPLKNKTHFRRPFRLWFRSNLLMYLERAQNSEPIFDQDRLGGGSIKYDWEHGDAEHQYAAEPGALIDRTRAPRWP